MAAKQTRLVRSYAKETRGPACRLGLPAKRLFRLCNLEVRPSKLHSQDLLSQYKLQRIPNEKNTTSFLTRYAHPSPSGEFFTSQREALASIGLTYKNPLMQKPGDNPIAPKKPKNHPLSMQDWWNSPTVKRCKNWRLASEAERHGLPSTYDVLFNTRSRKTLFWAADGTFFTTRKSVLEHAGLEQYRPRSVWTKEEFLAKAAFHEATPEERRGLPDGWDIICADGSRSDYKIWLPDGRNFTNRKSACLAVGIQPTTRWELPHPKKTKEELLAFGFQEGESS